MTWIAANTKWIMLVSGLLTSTAVVAAIAPQTALRHTFGVTLEGPAAEVVVRNWGVLVALIGVMLVCGAFNRAVRPLVLTVATVSKLTFLVLLVTVGRSVLDQQAVAALVSDAIQVTLFLLCLSSHRSGAGGRVTAE